MASPPSPLVDKVANPQGGMVDPKSLANTTASSENNKVVEPTSSAAGLVKQLTGLEIRDDRNNVNNKPINHLKIPAYQHDERKLFVGGLPTNVTEAEFLQFFEQFGEVIDSVVMIDRITKRSRGFGFVTFAKEEVAQSLLNSISGKTGVISIQGKNCEIKASEPKSTSSNAPRYIHGSGVVVHHPRNVSHHNHNSVLSNPGYGAPKAAAIPSALAPSSLPTSKGFGYPTSLGMTSNTNHALNDSRYYDSRNFDQLYSGAGYHNTSMYHHGGYQFSTGWEGSYSSPYNAYGYARGGADQYSMSHAHQGYYHPDTTSPGASYSQYNYPTTAAGYSGYANAHYSATPDYSGHQNSSTIQGAYRSDGSLESYGEGYYEGADGGTE